jgi:hypothetical protein
VIPAVIEYYKKGNILFPLVYMDFSELMDNYDSVMINIKQARAKNPIKKRRGA